jgi:YD repeat-containing protein
MPLARSLITALAFTCLFSACKKDDFPESGGKLLHRVVSDKDSLLSTTFCYDAQNRLVEIIDSNRQGHIWETSVEYNAAGNPVKFTNLYHWQSNSVSYGVVDSLVYENGSVIKKLQSYPYSPNSKDFHVTHTYAYDTKGRLITDFYGNSNRPDDVYAYTNFIYDAADDIIAIQEFNKSSGVMDSIRSITVTYNSDENPYSSIGLILYYVRGQQYAGDYHLLLLGKHNKTKVIYQYRNITLFTTNYTYKYDADGSLKRMFLSRSQGGQLNSTSSFDFFYQ